MARTVTGESAGVFGSYSTIALPQVPSPAVPATTVAAVNGADRAQQVVITAGSSVMTNVSVNGATAGTGAGTYTVPAGGSIVMTYTVASPTWAWSVPVSFLAALNANGTPVSVTGVS
jgi:hypothetical protein